MKKISLNWPRYVAFTLCGIFFVLSPIALEYYFSITNPNNTPYISEILTKHFVKISLSIIFFTGLINSPIFLLFDSGRKIFLVFLGFALYLFSALDFIHVCLFKARANSSSFYSIFSTNKEEAMEFVSDYSNLQLSGIFAIIVLPILIFYLYTSLFSHTVRKIISFFFLVVFLLAGFFIVCGSWANYFNEISAYKFYTSYINYKNELKTFGSYSNNQKAIHLSKLNFEENETHIIIIGESTGKYHMQLYGYDRATTPELEKIKNRLLIFNNIKSSSVHTISSLKDVFVLRDSNDHYSQKTLLDLFNQAGYKTYWLSNQQFLGENQALVSSIANRAGKKVFINPYGGNKFDGELIPELEKTLKEKEQKKIIFIHLMGTHLSYQERYPAAYNFFRTKNISFFGDHADSFINHYDNAIRYNDNIISEIIKITDSIDGINSIVYFSDHGDEVYDFRDFHGHSETILSKYMNSIPFLVYCNSTFNKVKNEKFKDSASNLREEYPLKNLSHTLQDLFDIESEYFDRSKSFFSKKEELPAGENEKSGNSNALFLPPFPSFQEKIWVHRVNSIERLHQIQDNFMGMELDVIYENGEFDVRHPPAGSINLSLDNFFSNVNEIRKHYFWLDIKNLESSNRVEIIKRLNFLAGKYRNKNNIIIETPSSELIPELNKAGFCTSYYLPDMASSNDVKTKEILEEIFENMRQNNPAAISQSTDNYMQMKENFTNSNKLIWALNFDWKDPANQERIKTLMKMDTTIKICLVNYQTPGWR